MGKIEISAKDLPTVMNSDGTDQHVTRSAGDTGATTLVTYLCRFFVVTNS